MIKLFMLITSLDGGGAEKVAAQLSNYFGELFEHKLVTITNVKKYSIKGPTISLELKFFNPKFLGYLIILPLAILKYRRLIKKDKPNVSLSFLILDNFINVLSNWNNKDIRIICSVRSVLSMKFKNPIFSLLFRTIITYFYSHADLIVVVSYGIKSELINYFKICPTKIVVINNPLDQKYIEKNSIQNDFKINFDQNYFYLINVGRLERAKGQWHLIRALSRVIEKVPCKLILCGDGGYKKYYLELINELKLNDYVILLGWENNPYKYIKKSSIFILPSIWDAYPNVLTEALAIGCPIIATDCKYGPREILENGRLGLLTSPLENQLNRPNDPFSEAEINLSNAIISLLENESLREHYSKLGLQSIDKNKIENIVSSYQKTFYFAVDIKK
jgi:glycosyltransferase involved in cell wall biosynthesis